MVCPDLVARFLENSPMAIFLPFVACSVITCSNKLPKVEKSQDLRNKLVVTLILVQPIRQIIQIIDECRLH